MLTAIRRTTTLLLVTAGLAGGSAADATATPSATGAAGLAPLSNGHSGGAGLTASVSAKPKPKVAVKPKADSRARRPAARHRTKVKPKPKPRRRAPVTPRRPVKRVTPKPKPSISTVPRRVKPIPSPAPNGATGADILAYAERFTGTPYVWGANGPTTFDCSGFTSYVFAHFGYRLDRTSYDQMTEGVPVHGPLQVGDLVFWDDGGHVGIYAGNDSFISATVHRGIWTYSFSVWGRTQSYTTARRLIGEPRLAADRVAATAAARAMPRNGGPADATP